MAPASESYRKNKIISGEMDDSRDFIQWLEQDMSLYILMYLEDPADLVRMSAVSSCWRDFVISNGLCKKLCRKMFPGTSSFSRVIVIDDAAEPLASGMNCVERANLEREHRVYASLCRDLADSISENCISDAIWASSTDNYPKESIKNTLEPRDRIGDRACYWSSKGESNPSVPETLIYKLSSKPCVITEFHVHPFQAYFQFGLPLYSANTVRLQIGHFKGSLDVESDERNEFLDVQHFSDDKFVWTYSSPEFPMVQENYLQKFKLPEPVLCIGGALRVELLGRVQTQEFDGRYYICINHVQAVGRVLSPSFDVEMIDEKGTCTLKYSPARNRNISSPVEMSVGGSSSRSPIRRFRENIRSWKRMIFSTFKGAGSLMIDEYDSDDDSD